MRYRIVHQLKLQHRTFSGNGDYRNEPEKIDETDSPRSARYLLGEYRLAHGQFYDVWVEDPSGNRLTDEVLVAADRAALRSAQA